MPGLNSPPIDYSSLPGGVVWGLIMKELESVRETQGESQKENREEFRRLRDKIESLESRVGVDIKTHAVDIKGLQIELEARARVAGAIAGAVTGLLGSLAGAILAYFLRTTGG